MSGNSSDGAPNAVVFGPNSNCTLDICPIEWSVYQYRPSIEANSAFLILFGIVMAVHIVLGVRWKSWWFMAFMVIGCLDAMLGYSGRIIMYRNPFSFIGFMLQIICVTGAPVFFTAAIYVTLSKTIEHLDPSISRMKPKFFYYIFIPADFLCLVLQAAGGALSTVSSGVSQVGVDLAMAGLVLQVVFIFTFCALFADYMIRYNRMRSSRPLVIREKLFFFFLSLSILLILVRSIFRSYELSEGYRDTDLITNEGLFIGLEGVLIMVAVWALCIGHPGFIFHPKTTEAVGPAREVFADKYGLPSYRP